MSTQSSRDEGVAAADWAGDRGRKWVEHMAATEAMLAPIDGPLIEALALDGVKRVADIGCGGGRTSCAIAARLTEDATVHGIDVSPDVIAAARLAARLEGFRVRDHDATRPGVSPPDPVPGSDAVADSASVRDASAGATVDFRCADAAIAAAPTEGYDRLTSRFGVMFFDDPPAAFANLAGWLRPGGRFAFTVWGPLGDNPWMSHLRRVVAEEVEVPAPPPDSPGPFRYADAAGFCGLLVRAGFYRVTAQPWRGKVLLGGGVPADEAAALSLSAFSVGDLLGHDAERVNRVRDRLTAILADSEVDGRVEMPASVHIVTGSRRP